MNKFNVVVRTNFDSVMIIVNNNGKVIFRGVSMLPKVRINGEYVYKNYKLLQECKNDGYCRDLLLLIDNFCLALKNNNISKLALRVIGPNYYFFFNILYSLGIEVDSIYNATPIRHNGCKPCIRVRKKDY